MKSMNIKEKINKTKISYILVRHIERDICDFRLETADGRLHTVSQGAG